MSMIESPSGRELRVTASDLVRHFGEWQDRAAREPVYILHRGRPRLVLTSLELMDALCAPHDRGGGEIAARLGGVLDAIDDIVLLTDRAGAIIAASRRARAIFGAAITPGAAIAQIADNSPFLADAIDRVVATRLPEATEVALPSLGGRRFVCVVEPAADGAIVLMRDATVAGELAALRARQAAMHAASAATGLTAWAIVSLRGHIERASDALAQMTGLALETLLHARLANLIEVQSRVAVGDAIERVIASDASPRSVAAHLFVNRATPIAVTVGIAALRHGGTVEGVAIEIVRAVAPDA